MNIFWEELTAGLTNHDQMLRVFIRLFAAILLGGLIGLQRGNAQKPSGLRIHTSVCLGTTVVLLSCSGVGLPLEGAVQGILIGIGFIAVGLMTLYSFRSTPQQPYQPAASETDSYTMMQ